jgi:hypothetical protein
MDEYLVERALEIYHWRGWFPQNLGSYR